MGSKVEPLTRSLTNAELAALMRALELGVADGTVVRAVCWPGIAEGQRNYRLTMSTPRAPLGPLHRAWLIERRGEIYRLRARPADADEIELLLEALREVAAIAPDGTPRIAEAGYDCHEHAYHVCFTPLEDMREGEPYARWILRRHRDARPLSVGYVLETRRGNAYATLRRGATLRGDPWSS